MATAAANVVPHSIISMLDLLVKRNDVLFKFALIDAKFGLIYMYMYWLYTCLLT